ncbi:BolA protein [Phytophthora cactorum]|nr:BolA protein [Phytophthora cactorum]
MHSVPKGSETHFKRHRMVNAVLQQELDDGVHALSILSKTPKQWEANAQVKPSPNCRGGMTVDESKKEFLEGLKRKHQRE